MLTARVLCRLPYCLVVLIWSEYLCFLRGVRRLLTRRIGYSSVLDIDVVVDWLVYGHAHDTVDDASLLVGTSTCYCFILLAGRARCSGIQAERDDIHGGL